MVPGDGRSEDARSVDGGEVAAEPNREPPVGLLELVMVDGVLELPVGVGVAGGAGENDGTGRGVVAFEPLQRVGMVDLDEREVRAFAGAPAAGALTAQQHADVHVGARGEPDDRAAGAVGTGGGREGLDHPAVRGGAADLDQPPGWGGAGEHPQVALQIAGKARHGSTLSRTIRWPPAIARRHGPW